MSRIGTWHCDKHDLDIPYSCECYDCSSEERQETIKKVLSVSENRATATQVGGDHYAKMAIQPMEYSMKNGLDPCQHTILKYVSRFRDKGGIEDLRKAKHVIDMLIQFEEEKGKS